MSGWLESVNGHSFLTNVILTKSESESVSRAIAPFGGKMPLPRARAVDAAIREGA